MELQNKWKNRHLIKMSVNELTEFHSLPQYLKNERVGEIFNNNTGNCIIIEYFDCLNCTVKFDDNTIIKNVVYRSLKTGNVKNPNYPQIYNIAYFGIGKYSSKNNQKIYTSWKAMLDRCYSINYSSYIGCSVDERWLNFQVFAEWFENNYIEGFALDKDILIKGNKIYSPETCCFVPQEINQLFSLNTINRGNLPIGISKSLNNFRVSFKKFTKQESFGSYNTIQEAFEIYKIEKEKYIKEVADIWKEKITTETHQALYNYQIKITD